MKGKTMAEIEVENCELKDRIKRLERTNEILRGNVNFLLDLSDEDERYLKIWKEAHDASVVDFVSLSVRAVNHANKAATLIDENKNRGGNSWKAYKPVHDLAKRYFRMKLRHDSGYFPGKAAREVREHCLKSDKYKNSSVPAQKTIKNNLIKKQG